MYPLVSLKSATSSVGFNDLINLLHKALLRMPHNTSCINFVLERNTEVICTVKITRLYTWKMKIPTLYMYCLFP